MFLSCQKAIRSSATQRASLKTRLFQRGEVARHKVVWRERQESLTDVQALRVKLQDADIRWLADIRAANVFVDMMPTNHALVHVLFQVFLALPL